MILLRFYFDWEPFQNKLKKGNNGKKIIYFYIKQYIILNRHVGLSVYAIKTYQDHH